MNADVGQGDRPAAVTGTMVGRYMLGRVVGKGLSSEVRQTETHRERESAGTTDCWLRALCVCCSVLLKATMFHSGSKQNGGTVVFS